MKKVTLKNVNVFAAKREPFDCNGTLTGEWIDYAPHTGMMTDFNEIKSFDSMFHDIDDTFVILSYSTPVAAWNSRDGWWINSAGYTNTTKRHKSALNLV